MSEEWLVTRLGNLQIEDQRTNALSELKSHLISTSPGDNSVFDRVLHSNHLFECLDEKNR